MVPLSVRRAIQAFWYVFAWVVSGVVSHNTNTARPLLSVNNTLVCAEIGDEKFVPPEIAMSF
jgi:hypothetical protein